ncbi:TonB-dependent receptor [Apibacter adventoris]|uniref:Prevent-host-death protein n=1 Tax=Apibacter adventoris TaxID=1679466 RepID=A0A2S8AE11_9FLAO|nr:carboxypeptidase-like regulatory domain-containing protein [Apibacter adventoris]PQL93064.1 prevent-host-death protein [Apibacter adventoris]
MKYFVISFLIGFLCYAHIKAQVTNDQFTQTIRGITVDSQSGKPLSFISIGISDIPEIGTTTDEQGNFILKNVPVGRHTIQATCIGYQPFFIREILVTTSKEVYLEIPMTESSHELSEITISAYEKDAPINKMALTGARMLSVEEASRFAGGLDDPARLISSFAGIASAPSSNGISVHGNAPHLLQWRLEDVEIPNPNHFADIQTLGGGILSSLSNKVLGNSDFFSAAFPAEYGNAVSGVFDMRMRNGNTQNREYTLQIGTLGIDLASEGAINKKQNSSYIINYRYSLIGLMNKIDKDSTSNHFNYQDLNFKLNFPTKKTGTFSVWGTALYDSYKQKFEKDQEKWEYFSDRNKGQSKQYMLSGGLTHRYFFNDNTMLKSSLASTYAKYNVKQDVFDANMNSTPYGYLDSHTTNLIFNASLNKKFSHRFTNKTGFTYTKMFYGMNLQKAPHEAYPLETISQGKGNTELISGYTSASFGLSDRVTFNQGIYSQILTLNNHWTIEPRISMKWKSGDRTYFAIAYGMHSRMEKIDVFFVKTQSTGSKSMNKDLDFTKAHHAMFTYSYKLSDNTNLKIEPYFQYLYDVPVIADSSYSVLNRDQFYVEEPLVNKGKGTNLGIDITLERYLNKGYYYLITATLFDSRYKGGDGVWHNTKFNRNYILNASGGKEWIFGKRKNKILSANLRLTLQGGDRYSPLDVEATMNDPDKEAQYNERKAYSKQLGAMLLLNYTLSYRVNNKKRSYEWGIVGLNATSAKEFYGHRYNFKTGAIEKYRDSSSIGNLYYKLEF